MNSDWIDADELIEDKNHAARGLRQAVRLAADSGCKEVRLRSGVYVLDEFETIDTPSIAHDDGCGDIHEKECFLAFSGIAGLTIRGECGGDGEPATVLAGASVFPEKKEGEPSGLPPQTLLPAILWAEDCEGLTLENLAVTRRPETASAGVVTRVSGREVEVEVFEGLPCEEGMAAYCMNRFSLAERRLEGESLTYGFGYDNRFQKTGPRMLCLEDEELAGKVKPGEGLSWHRSGRTDFQLFFGGCDRLCLSNIRVYDTNGFAVLTENCRGITARRLVIKPEGSQLFTGPRDGWKIYRCGGRILLTQCHVEGVRMDGQNVHSNFLKVEERIGERELVCTCKYAPVPLRLPSAIGIYRGSEMEETELEGWEFAGGCEETSAQSGEETAGTAVAGAVNHLTKYRLRTKHPLPEEVGRGCFIHALCWEPESYVCRDSVFKNIAGAGHLLRCRNVEIRGCRYENLMNAGILIGAELSTHCEGGHGGNIVIEDCSFINCGFKPRYGPYGMGGVAVKSQGFSGPYNKNIRIKGCRFENCSRGIELRDAKDVSVTDCSFDGAGEPLLIEKESCENVSAEGIERRSMGGENGRSPGAGPCAGFQSDGRRREG